MSTEKHPYTDEEIKSWGYVAWRWLPDGELIGVVPMAFGNGRLCRDLNPFGCGDGYCYDGVLRAVHYMNVFDPEKESEPDGWKRHIQSGRRRPDGDKTKEYVNP